MAVYLISYDLDKPGQNYAKVHQAIQSVNPDSWAKPLESVWLVKSDASAEVIKNHILRAMDQNDKLLVIQVMRNASAFNLPTEVWQWIERNL